MKMKRLNEILLLFWINLSLTLARECKQIDSCSCVWDDTNVRISLKNLDGGNEIRFKNMELTKSETGKKTGYKLDYNPCTPFNEGSGDQVCTDVIACQASDDNNVHYSAGKPKQMTTTTVNNNLVFKYDGGIQSGYSRATWVTLKCSESATTPSVSQAIEYVQMGGSIYKFTLTTACACDSGCKGGSSGGSHGLSTGSLLCILFFVFLIVYFVGGFLFLKFYKHNEGTDAIPQYEFWKDFPAKVKDGFVFTKEKICNKDNQYQEI